jgi:hypothetical protein
MACYPAGPRCGRAFIVTPYVVGPDDVLGPEMPAACPRATGEGEKGCRLGIHHRRKRKSGPRHPLVVATCRTHGGSFTLYPPGHRPYARAPLVRLAPDGKELAGRDSSEGAFQGTPFEAAFDARRGQAWARESAAGAPERWWSTQGRHLRLAARLVGVAGDLAERVRERVAAVLSVGALFMRERSRARGYRQIGRAVCEVLAQLRAGASRPRALLVAGHLTGQWGEPLHWDVRRQVLYRAPFRGDARRDVT